MSGKIPQNFIDDLLNRTDIIDLIDSFVPLRKAGQSHLALCPFHDEKTPSFNVIQDKQFYHCFGCGANGNAISFLMEYSHLGFVEAVEELARRAGVEIPREAGDIRRDSESTELYELLELVVRFYRLQLREHPQAQRAVDYLKQRGISGELAAQFELGYAPAGWDNLIRELGKSETSQKRLAMAGMTIQRENGGYYDRFRDRIIFPIRDQRGRVIGFGGRVIDDGTPKYLNSPETPIFHKGRELYGLYQARHANKDMQRLFIVEGYMDALALAQHGIANVAATLGTAATGDHLEQVFRTTPQAVFCFDGDKAGQKAAWRALETCLPLLRDGRQAFFRFMPPGEDPDSFVRLQGQEKFQDLSDFTPLSDYLLAELSQDINLSILEERSLLIHKSLPYLKKLPHSNLKQLLINEVAKLTQSNPAYIEQQLSANREPTKGKREPDQRPARGQQRTLLTQTIKLLLRRPQLALTIDEADKLEDIELPGADFLAEIIQLIRLNPDINCARIIENWRGTKFEQRLSQLATESQTQYLKDEEVFSTVEYLESEFEGALQRMRDISRKRKVGEFSQVSSTSQLSDEQKTQLRSLNPGGRSIQEN